MMSRNIPTVLFIILCPPLRHFQWFMNIVELSIFHSDGELILPVMFLKIHKIERLFLGFKLVYPLSIIVRINQYRLSYSVRHELLLRIHIEKSNLFLEAVSNCVNGEWIGDSLNADRFLFVQFFHIKGLFSSDTTQVIVQLVASLFYDSLQKCYLLILIQYLDVFEVLLYHLQFQDIFHMNKTFWIRSYQLSELYVEVNVLVTENKT